MSRRGAAEAGYPMRFQQRRMLRADAVNVDPGALLRTMRQVIAETLGDGIQVSLRGAYHLCSILVSPFELERTLRELTSNARDLLPAGGLLDVTISQHVVPDDGRVNGLPDGRYLVIGFSDTTFGMSPQALRRVFDDCPGANEWRASIVERLCRIRRFAVLSGGDMMIESRIGVGAKTDLYLPAA